MRAFKEAAIATLRVIGIFFTSIGFGFVALWDWAKGFAFVKDVSGFFFPKIAVVLLGKLLTPFPWWLLFVLSFIPPPAVMLIYFLTIIVVLKQ